MAVAQQACRSMGSAALVLLLPLLACLHSTSAWGLCVPRHAAAALQLAASPRWPPAAGTAAGAATPVTAPRMAIIVGKGRIGNALFDMGGGTDTLVGRADAIPDGEGPIYVCTRNDDLADVIARTPRARRADLVFLQNGILGPFLEEHGLQDNTQALVYFAVAKKGDAPTDGVTDINPEGLTAATGKWAAAFQERLAAGGLSCHIVNREDFVARAFEKHIWICAFMLVGTRHAATVGEVEAKHGDEVRQLIQELLAATTAEHGVRFRPGAPDRLCAYARAVASYPTSIKERPWRNDWFWRTSRAAIACGEPDATPIHTKLLKITGVILPPSSKY